MKVKQEVWYNILFSYFMEYKALHPPTQSPQNVCTSDLVETI